MQFESFHLSIQKKSPQNTPGQYYYSIMCAHSDISYRIDTHAGDSFKVSLWHIPESLSAAAVRL